MDVAKPAEIEITSEVIEAVLASILRRGWKLVPIIPTEKMLDEATESAQAENAAAVWRDMLLAAPNP